MDFWPYAQPYLDRIFFAEGEPIPLLIHRYAAGWSSSIGEQFLVHHFDPLPAPGAPALMPGFATAHLKALVLSRRPDGVRLAATHCPSLLKRDIAFEIGIVIGQEGVQSAQIAYYPAFFNEMCLFLLEMGSLETLSKTLNVPRS